MGCWSKLDISAGGYGMNTHGSAEMEYESVRNIKQQYARYTKRLWHFYWLMVTIGLIVAYSVSIHLLIESWNIQDSFNTKIGFVVFIVHACCIFYLLYAKRIQYCCFLLFIFANWWLLMFVTGFLMQGNEGLGLISAIFYFTLIFSRKSKPHSCIFSTHQFFWLLRKSVKPNENSIELTFFS
jgi:hypothetical protein